jgi:hypothetical protein
LSGTLYIGINGDLPGWSLGDSPPIGFDADLIKFLQEKHGFTARYRRLLPKNRDTALQTCYVNLVIANYSRTPDRDRGFRAELVSNTKFF